MLLPHSIFVYLTHKWSERIYRKLIQTCKYFYLKYRIIVLKTLYFVPYQNQPYWIYDSSSHQLISSEKINIDLSTTKLWLSHSVSLEDHDFAWLKKTIYKSNIEFLWLKKQVLRFDDLNMLFSPTRIKYVFMLQVKIIYDSGVEATSTDVLSLMPNIVAFIWYVS